jgi:hypothetical protein
LVSGKAASQHVHRGGGVLDEQLGVVPAGRHAEFEPADAREQPDDFQPR